MNLILNTLAFSAKRKYLNGLTKSLTHFLAGVVIKNKKIKEVSDLAELSKQWQKGFPTPSGHPITKIDENTVYAEIHTHCPLRGSGNTLACYKMMEFDRKIVEKAGGEFVVLESQSNSGKHFCKVAMRLKGQNMDDLQEVHLK